ncbi:MAG TPA: hypothetical protein VGL11_09685 [Candidatus Binatia bacterium]
MADVPNDAPPLLARAKSSIDLLVPAATIVYALGYFSWAVFSWDRELDLPPALEGQYLIAGIVPALLLILLVLSVVGFARLVAKGGRRFNQKWHGVLDACGGILIVGGFVSMLVTKSWISAVMITLGLVASVASVFFSREKTDRIFARIFSWYGRFAAVLLFIPLTAAYATRIFPHLPSEFGGPELSCVRLDLKRADLSEPVLELLAEPAASGAQPATVHSRAVNILSAPGRYYLIAVPKSQKIRYMKLNPDLVHAIVPADQCKSLSP